MVLHLLPTRSGGAAENMAADFLLLKQYPKKHDARFRAYGWHRPAFTFGYSQKLAFVQAQLPADERVELCRRPSGGGVVDHREDWTYSLVLPRGHSLADAPAPVSYREIHAALARALTTLGEVVELKPTCDATEGECPASGPGVCFSQPEKYDVLNVRTGAKVAGAAQKRTKEGLLCQGSLARTALSAPLDDDALLQHFTTELATLLALPAEETAWPDFPEGAWENLTEHYQTEAWIAFR